MVNSVMLTFPISRFAKVVVFSGVVLIAILHISHAWPVKSYKELRYKHVRGQNTLASCGPASLATLFGEFYGDDISEGEIVELIKPHLEQEIDKLKEGQLPEGGVSMLDLKRVTEELGVAAKGYEIPENRLLSIIDRLRAPLLIHLEEPDEHFSLTVTSFNGRIFLADPAWGIRSISKRELFERWDGLILAFSPGKSKETQAQSVIRSVEQLIVGRRHTHQVSREFLWDFSGLSA